MRWTKALTLTCFSLLGTPGLISLPAIAEEYLQCPSIPTLDVGTVSVDTKLGIDAVGKLLAKIGLGINVRDERDNVLKANPRADQVMIVLTMANIYCKMIWSDSTLKGDEKAARFEKLMHELLERATGPTPVARTAATGWWNQKMITLASNVPFDLAEEPELALPKPQVGYLRDPPFLINDYNKYFVIVGSASTREEGLRLMKTFKSKAPQYDFALYEPYGNNSHFGIMMASWVPHDVALQVLDIAKQTLAHDAFIWACRDTGDSC